MNVNTKKFRNYITEYLNRAANKDLRMVYFESHNRDNPIDFVRSCTRLVFNREIDNDSMNFYFNNRLVEFTKIHDTYVGFMRQLVGIDIVKVGDQVKFI